MSPQSPIRVSSQQPTRTSALSMAALLALATGLPLAPAAAQCNISRTGTPDFDQRRLSQLPNDGRMYCGPVAIANALALLSDSGYPDAFAMAPNINWQSSALHATVSTRIAQLGILMSTDAFNGTNLNNSRIGTQQWLDQNAPGEFVVNGFFAFENLAPSPQTLYNAQKLGGYVMPIWGRYNFDGVGFTRSGGHMITMTALQGACGNTPRMFWRDPDDAGAQPDTFQSLFTTQSAFLVLTNGPYRPSANAAYTPGMLYRFSNDANRVLDGYLAITPLKFGTLSQSPGEIAAHNPVQPTGLLLPAVQKFQVPSPAPSHDVVIDPRLNAYYVSTQAAPGSPEHTWKVEEGMAAVPIMQNDNPAHLATGRAGELFIADGRTLIAMNVWAETPAVMGSILLPHPADAIAYDDTTDTLMALSISARTLMLIERDLVGPVLSHAVNPQIPLGGEGTLTFGPAGLIYLASSASPNIFELQATAGAGYILSDILVSSNTAPPQGLQVDTRNHVFCIRDGIIEELEKNPATGAWVPAANSILAGKPAHKRLTIATSRTNYNHETMSGPEYREIGPADPAGIPDCYANCDLSTTEPVLNVDDFTCFINAFAIAQSATHEAQILHYANCDNSTTAPVLNVDDFTCFINQFALGCPAR